MWLLQQAQRMSPSELAREFASDDELPATFTREDIIREGSEPFTDDDEGPGSITPFSDINEELDWYKSELRRVQEVSCPYFASQRRH